MSSGLRQAAGTLVPAQPAQRTPGGEQQGCPVGELQSTKGTLGTPAPEEQTSYSHLPLPKSTSLLFN